jgi:hypothetical protein
MSTRLLCRKFPINMESSMTSETVVTQLEDQQLRVHKEVHVSWTRDGLSYRGRGQIVSLRPRQATVELLHPVGRNGEYAAGDLVQVPRYADHLRWSSGRRVRKISAEPFIHKDYL